MSAHTSPAPTDETLFAEQSEDLPSLTLASPGVAIASLAALRLLQSDASIVKTLWDNTTYFKKGLNEFGFNTGRSETPIKPVTVSESKLAQDLSRGIYDRRAFVLRSTIVSEIIEDWQSSKPSANLRDRHAYGLVPRSILLFDFSEHGQNTHRILKLL